MSDMYESIVFDRYIASLMKFRVIKSGEATLIFLYAMKH